MLQQRRQQLRHTTAVNGHVMAFRPIIYTRGNSSSSCWGEHDVTELNIYVYNIKKDNTSKHYNNTKELQSKYKQVPRNY